MSEGTCSAQRILRDVPLAAPKDLDSQQYVDTIPVGRWPDPTPEEIHESHEHESGMQMLGYLLIALAIAAGAVVFSIVIAIAKHI